MRKAVICSLLAGLLAACNGGTVDRHALQKDSEAVDSLACEGALLAHEIANDASISTFSRVHAGELAQRASNFEDALSERPTSPGIEAPARALARKAGRVADLLTEIENHPSDAGRAQRLQGRLERAGGCA